MRAMLQAQINKTDRNDARGIAQMMRVGLYRPVHVKTLRSQKLRMLLPSRPGELHPESLTDPDVILSHHPARATMRRLPPSIDDQVPPAAG